MSNQPWHRVPRTGSVMDVDPSQSQPRAQVTFDLEPLPPPLTQNGDTVSRKRRRMLSPESSEETVDDRRDFERNPQDPRRQGPSRPPSVAPSHETATTDEMYRLAITGPVAYGEYYEKWPDTESDDEPGLTQPAAEDPPTPTQTELPLGGAGDGQVGTTSGTVFRNKLTKEDTLMSIDFSSSQSQDNSAPDDALGEKLGAMFDQMRQKQRDDMEVFVESIKAHLIVECADLKNEMTRLRAELVDLRLQYQRMQNGR